jgi:hypothetical protein
MTSKVIPFARYSCLEKRRAPIIESPLSTRDDNQGPWELPRGMTLAKFAKQRCRLRATALQQSCACPLSGVSGHDADGWLCPLLTHFGHHLRVLPPSRRSLRAARAFPPQENEVAEAGHQPALIWSHRRCMAQFRIARAIRQFADVRLLTRIAFGPVAALIWRPFLLSIGASHPCGSRI